jgi:hypothetical protein
VRLVRGLAMCPPSEGVVPLEPGDRGVYLAALAAARTNGTLLAASSLTASFLGAQAIRRSRESLGTLEIFALISLAASMLLCINVLLPKSGFVFSLSAPRMYESLFEVANDACELHRRLIYWLEDYWQILIPLRRRPLRLLLRI